MKVVLLRVGIDTGSGGIHGPLFADGSFEFIPIPDGFGVDSRAYGNTLGRSGRYFIDYFPRRLQPKMTGRSMHVDPEFSTFTYGDPTPPKAGLRRLVAGDILAFYCGLKGWDVPSAPALYLVAYFEVAVAGRAEDFDDDQISGLFGENSHVRHPDICARQRGQLVLVKGSPASRLLTTAVPISVIGHDRIGRPIKLLSPEMQKIFGSFDGKVSIQRSPPRWVDEKCVARAAEFLHSLP